MDKPLLGLKGLNPNSFAPATSKDFPAGTIALQQDHLILPKDSKCGIPGIFQPLVDQRRLDSPSYNLITKGISFLGHDIVRCIVTPASDITVIPCDLSDLGDTKESGFQMERSQYSLRSFKNSSSTTKTGYFISVKLGLILRSTRDLAQRFQIDGAVLLDPGLSTRFPFEGRPVCLLGMDFITKYPYLFYVPRPDSSGMIDFMIARDPFASRSYSIHELFYKTVIIHVDGYHDKDTGRIGCGIFFKSGSVFNMLSGVSEYDKAGNKLTTKLKERGILMGIIKALHVVRAFPVGRDFRGVIIRSTDPAIARLMAVTQVTMRNVLTDPKITGEDGFDPMGGYYYPTANRDLMLYLCHTFLQEELGFKITFEDSKNYGESRAANMLAIAASQMEVFCIKRHVDGTANKSLSPFTKATRQNITTLGDYVELGEDSLYISLGLDGYFNIQQKKAHEVMEAADLAGVCPEDGVAYKVTSVTLSDKYAAISGRMTDTNKYLEKDKNAVADIKKNIEKKMNGVVDSRIVENGLEKGLKSHKDAPHGDDRIRMREINADLAFIKPGLGYHHEMKMGGSVLKRMEKRIRTEAKTRISKVKKEGECKYESAEEQMMARIARINEDGSEKHKNITKETDAKLTATRVEFDRRRDHIVSETRAKIEMIKAEVSRSLELVGWKALKGAGKDRAISGEKVIEGAEWAVNDKPRRPRPLTVDYYSESE